MNGLEREIVAWYQENKRILPWRIDKNPYHVWLSEIMLQQTRIEAVIDYYKRFLKRLPTIKDLANIEEDELLKLWEGLGYYNRARNLQKAAKIIIEKYHGKFPESYEEVLNLPGIGEYTASAITSICFKKKECTIDGNVLRVYTRFYNDPRNVDLAITKKEIRNELMQNIPEEAGDFNEGLMEIGETICLPKGMPKCENCPLKSKCEAKKKKTWDKFPVKGEKIKQKQVSYTILLLEYNHKFAIAKRRENGLLNHLWEFPNLEGNISKKRVQEYLKEGNLEVAEIKKFISSKHVFSHQIWQMTSYQIKLKKDSNKYIWATLEELKEKYAIPTAFQPFLKEIEKKTCINKKK